MLIHTRADRPDDENSSRPLQIDIRVPGHGRLTNGGRGCRSGGAERLTNAGGKVLDEFDGHHILMAGPEGNEFCAGAASSETPSDRYGTIHS
ncbi:VOC family protein [Streptomyces sp. OE57]|uniref:VOC family protein n=1 Tax=Streptomyces lacaronensis TaxID=3379885 RepID=UPI0039B73EC7